MDNNDEYNDIDQDGDTDSSFTPIELDTGTGQQVNAEDTALLAGGVITNTIIGGTDVHDPNPFVAGLAQGYAMAQQSQGITPAD